MGCLQVPDERPDDCAGQTARYQAGRSGGNLAEANGQMPAAGGGARGKGLLWDDTACRRGGGGDRGHHPCDARPLGGTQTRGGLGIYPHLRA